MLQIRWICSEFDVSVEIFIFLIDRKQFENSLIADNAESI